MTRRLIVAMALIGLLAASQSQASGAPVAGPDQTCRPGETIQVRGDGARAGASLLLAFGLRTVGGGVADASGRYQLALAVGQERGGAYEVRVLARESRREIQRFRCVVPGPSAPPAATPGMPTVTARPTASPAVTTGPPPFVAGQCEPAYPDLCLPIGNDVDCPDIPWRNFRLADPRNDPYRLDGDGDGVACEEP